MSFAFGHCLYSRTGHKLSEGGDVGSLPGQYEIESRMWIWVLTPSCGTLGNLSVPPFAHLQMGLKQPLTHGVLS